MLFNRTPPIYALIDEYTAWNQELYPLRAGAERALLLRYVAANKIWDIDDFAEEGKIAFFVGEELSEYFSGRARIAFASFLRYCRWAGHLHVPATETKLREFMATSKGGRPVNAQMIGEVRELKGRGMAPGPIYRDLRRRFPFVHRGSVYRWYQRA